MKLIEIEKEYIDAYKSQWTHLKSVFDKTKEVCTKKDLERLLGSNDITLCLIQRLTVYLQTQENIKVFLNKRKKAPASDFFVESVIYFLKFVLEISNSKLEARSERAIKPKRKSIRPDISIWKNDNVVSIIECKTQLGWNRSGWQSDFEKREKKLKDDYPDANAYLLVMTGGNWGGFSKEHRASGKYYCISEKYPTEIDIKSPSGDILTPTIEELFKLIIEKG